MGRSATAAAIAAALGATSASAARIAAPHAAAGAAPILDDACECSFFGPAALRGAAS